MSQVNPSRIWVGVPWTIQAYLALSLVGQAMYLSLDGFHSTMIGSVLIGVGLFYGMARGSRAVWIIAVVLNVLSLLAATRFARDIVEDPSGAGFLKWFQLVWVLLSLGLLLHPRTRDWCIRRLQLS